MAVHYKSTSGNSSICRTRGGYRTKDIWRITCKKCLAKINEITQLEELRKGRND